MFIYTSYDSGANFARSASKFYIFFIDYSYTKVQSPGVTVPILQVHEKIFEYKYMTHGMWSATAHSGLLDFSVPALDKKDDECCSHPDLASFRPIRLKKSMTETDEPIVVVEWRWKIGCL